jgi:hypothetical protein
MLLINLKYKYGMLDSLNILVNTVTQKEIPNVTKTALFDHCKFNIHWYRDIEIVNLLCLVDVNYTVYGEKGHNIIDKIMSNQKSTMDLGIYIIPISSDVPDDMNNYLLYNSRECDTPVISVFDLRGRSLHIKNNNLIEYQITELLYDATIFNYYNILIFSDENEININTTDVINMKLSVKDFIYLNQTTKKVTSKISPSLKKDYSIVDDNKCICGKDLILENKKIICSSIDLCDYELTNIIEVYLSIVRDDELYKLFLDNYTQAPQDFINYLISLDCINFYELNNESKNKIFFMENKIIDFPKEYNIKDCKKLIPYSYNVIKNKQGYLTILEGLYNDK